MWVIYSSNYNFLQQSTTVWGQNDGNQIRRLLYLYTRYIESKLISDFFLYMQLTYPKKDIDLKNSKL